jgi:hypothetical protein
MDEFIQKTGSDLDQNVDYSQIDLQEQVEGGEELARIDEIFQPLNIPKKEIPESEYEIPEDPLMKADIQDGPALGGSLPMDEEPDMENGNIPPSPNSGNLPNLEDQKES